jgi:hypothetical protein
MTTGDLNADWLDFLTGQEAVKIIQELDIKLIEAIESFCQDIKDALLVLPYYKTYVIHFFRGFRVLLNIEMFLNLSHFFVLNN